MEDESLCGEVPILPSLTSTELKSQGIEKMPGIPNITDGY